MAVVIFCLNLREFLSIENKKNLLKPNKTCIHGFYLGIFITNAFGLYIRKKYIFQEALLRKWVLPAFKERVLNKWNTCWTHIPISFQSFFKKLKEKKKSSLRYNKKIIIKFLESTRFYCIVHCFFNFFLFKKQWFYFLSTSLCLKRVIKRSK